MNLSSTYRPEDDLSHVTSPDLTSDLVEFGTPVNHGTSELNTMFIDEELREDDNTRKHSDQDMFGKKLAPKTTEQTPPKRGWMQKARSYVLPLAVLLGTAVSTSSCDNDDPKPKPPTQVEPPKNETPKIDRKTDNPEHLAEFMKDVKPAVLADGVAKLEFDAVWTGTEYQLIPIPVLSFDLAKSMLEEDAKQINVDVNNCVFLFYYRGSGVRIAWEIPYSNLKNRKGKVVLSNSEFDSFILNSELSEGTKNSTVKKGSSGNLSLFRELKDVKRIGEFVINPYYYGK